MIDLRDLDRQQAALWAHEILSKRNWVILDTETTGLENNDQICQIAAIDHEGKTLIDTLVKPTVSISAGAQSVHGISDADVQTVGSFDEVFLELLKAIGNRSLIVYNAEFDLRLIQQSLKAHNIYIRFEGKDRTVATGVKLWPYSWINWFPVHCAMHWYSQWVGDYSEYHGNYRWQRLPSGDHTALGDCRATLEVIRKMAVTYQPDLISSKQVETARESLEPASFADQYAAPIKHSPVNDDAPYDEIPF